MFIASRASRQARIGLVARVVAAALAGLGLAAASVSIADAVALTLSRGPDASIALSLDDLAALPQVTIVTANDYTDGEVAYRGPLVRDVIGPLGLGDAAILRFTAANDYYVEIPTREFRRYDVILAMEADGARLSRRDKGPLWLMYPISDHPELQNPVYVERLIWQVVRIEAL